MKFPTIKPAMVAEVGDQMGMPPGKKMSVRNMARVAMSARKRRPKAGVNPGTAQSYA